MRPPGSSRVLAVLSIPTGPLIFAGALLIPNAFVSSYTQALAILSGALITAGGFSTLGTVHQLSPDGVATYGAVGGRKWLRRFTTWQKIERVHADFGGNRVVRISLHSKHRRLDLWPNPDNAANAVGSVAAHVSKRRWTPAFRAAVERTA